MHAGTWVMSGTAAQANRFRSLLMCLASSLEQNSETTASSAPSMPPHLVTWKWWSFYWAAHQKSISARLLTCPLTTRLSWSSGPKTQTTSISMPTPSSSKIGVKVTQESDNWIDTYVSYKNIKKPLHPSLDKFKCGCTTVPAYSWGRIRITSIWPFSFCSRLWNIFEHFTQKQ